MTDDFFRLLRETGIVSTHKHKSISHIQITEMKKVPFQIILSVTCFSLSNMYFMTLQSSRTLFCIILMDVSLGRFYHLPSI